jgi:hypothetical protein
MKKKKVEQEVIDTEYQKPGFVHALVTRKILRE